MGWKLLGRTAEGAAVYVHVPDVEAPQPGPPKPPGVKFDLGVRCEAGQVYPCTRRTPRPATVMVRASHCNCRYKIEDLVTAMCDLCFLQVMKELKAEDEYQCECGVIYRPGTAMIRDVVNI